MLKEFETLTHVNFKQELYTNENAEKFLEDNKNNSKADQDKNWKKIIAPDLSFLNELEEVINAAKGLIEIIYEPTRVGVEIINKIETFIGGKVIDPAEKLIDTSRTIINNTIDKIGGSGGMHIMYKSPIDINIQAEDTISVSRDETGRITRAMTDDNKEIDSSTKFDSFWNRFRESFNTDNEFERDYIPSFNSNEYVGGIAILAMAPGIDEVTAQLKEFLRLFDINFITFSNIQVQKEIDANLKFRFTSIFNKNSLSLEWDKLSFPHWIKVTSIKARDIESNKVTDILVDLNLPEDGIYKNIGEKELDINRIDDIPILYGHEYTAAIELYTAPQVAAKLRESLSLIETLVFTDLLGRHIDRTTFGNFDATQIINTNETSQIVPLQRTDGVDFLKKRFFGNFGDGDWFGTTLQWLIPEIETLKNEIKFFIDSLYEQIGRKENLLDAISNSLSEKIETVTNVVDSIRNRILILLDKLTLSINGEFLVIKTIQPQLGGINKFISDIANTNGISNKQKRDSNYIGGIFLVAGGLDPANITSLINFIELFIKEDEDKEQTKQAISEFKEVTQVLNSLNSFDLDGLDSEFVDIVKG